VDLTKGAGPDSAVTEIGAPEASSRTVAAKSRHAGSNGQTDVPKGARWAGESDDDYPHIVATLDTKTRVIECAHGIQWIIQKRCKAARWPWRSVYFCRTKTGLLLYARPITPELLALPDCFERRNDGERIDWPPSDGGAA